MPALIECVPNFSEGRDKSKVDAILEAMKMGGVYLLDREMDADHNRCVITLVGDPVNVAEAAIRGVGKAAELIDLTKHTGAHNREQRSVKSGRTPSLRRRPLAVSGTPIRREM